MPGLRRSSRIKETKSVQPLRPTLMEQPRNPSRRNVNVERGRDPKASWSSPYDHPQNGAAEENVHTQCGDLCAAMCLSGARSGVLCRFQSK